MAASSAVLLLAAGGVGQSAGADTTEDETPDEPDITVIHDGLTPAPGFEEFEGCPFIIGSDVRGQGLCLRLSVSGPLNFGDVDADIEEPMELVIGLRAGNDETPAYVAMAQGEDGEPQKVEGGLLGVPELDPVFAPVDGLTQEVAGAPVWGINAAPDIADPDAQVDQMVEGAFLFPALAGILGVDEGEEIDVDEALSLFGASAEDFFGDQTLGLPISIQLQNLLFGENCYIGTPDDRININLTTGTTDPPEGVEPMTGGYGSFMYNEPDPDRPFHYIGRILGSSFVDNTFSVPGASGCDAVVGGLLEQEQGLADPVINQQTGLPSAPGNNVADFSIDFSVATTYSVYPAAWTGTPTEIHFGEVTVGESSAPQTIVIENTGTRPSIPGAPYVDSDDVAWSNQLTWDEAGTEGNTCTGVLLEVGDQCQVTVRATPDRLRSGDEDTYAGQLGFFQSGAVQGVGDVTERVNISVTPVE